MSSTSPIIDKHAGKRFLMVRKHLKLNQAEMAELCEISQGMVSLIEKGEREISQGVFKILFIKKNISPTYLIAGEGSIEYRKVAQGSSLVTNIKELQTEIEVMKGQIKLLLSRSQR